METLTIKELKNMLADFSIEHHRWLLTEEDKRTFSQLTDEFLNTIKETVKQEI